MDINDLVALVKTLRKKCPWDRKQTLTSIKNNLIEEIYEVIQAIENHNLPQIKEEIGDIIFLGIFLAKVLEEEKGVRFNKLISITIKKYKDKHPHVYKKKKAISANDVLKFWQKSKKDVFEGLPISLPALLAAKIIQERAAKLGFDWNSHKGPLEKCEEELRELKLVIKSSEKSSEEFGDLLFSCVNLARHLGIDPEEALRRANKKFVTRFRQIACELKKKRGDIESVTLEEMDKIWNEIKRKY